MTDTSHEIDLANLERFANREAKMQADAGYGEGSSYEDRLASLLPEARRRAGLPDESSYQTDARRSGLNFPDEP